MIERLDELRQYLEDHGVTVYEMDWQRTTDVERDWRAVYGQAFTGQPRLRQGHRAEGDYSQVICSRYRVLPFNSNLPGTPVAVHRQGQLRGLECVGKLIPLGRFHAIEFFISPDDYEWTMVHTHEDHGSGGPYFVRAQWIP